MLTMILFFACASEAEPADTGSVRYLVSLEDLECPAEGRIGIPLASRIPLDVLALEDGTATPWQDWQYSRSDLAIWCPDSGAVRIVWGGGE